MLPSNKSVEKLGAERHSYFIIYNVVVGKRGKKKEVSPDLSKFLLIPYNGQNVGMSYGHGTTKIFSKLVPNVENL